MEWIKTEDKLPEFGELVLVYCRIYGIFLASYELIGEFDVKFKEKYEHFLNN